MRIILTVQSIGNRNNRNVKYRFAISHKNFRNHFIDAQKITVKLNGEEISSSLPTEQCPELYHARIDEWIKENNFHNYENRNPTKLEFGLTKINSEIILAFEDI